MKETIQIDYKTYTLDSVLHQGITTTSYLGHIQKFDPITESSYDKKVVIKMMKTESPQPDMIVLLKRLKEISGYMESEEYMVPYIDWTETKLDGVSMIITVTEFLEGYDLETYFTTSNKDDYNTMLNMMTQISKSLDYLHTYGIAHRNIKPSNIYFDESVNKWKLIDYSLSCTDTAVCGSHTTNKYTMTPESVLNKPVTFISMMQQDIWSLGTVFYAMANEGAFIVQGEDIRQSLINIAGGSESINPSSYSYQPINSIIMSMLNVRPEMRPTSGQLVFLFYLSRPGCKIDNVTYTHDTVKTMLYSMGQENSNMTDYQLCTDITDKIRICPINKNGYVYEDLVQMASMIGLTNIDKMNTDQLCQVITLTLQTSLHRVKQEVTEDIVRAIQYRAMAQAHKQDSKFTNMATTRINKHFDKIYEYANENNLIDIDMLEKYRIEIRKKYDHYKNSDAVGYATVFGFQNDYIIYLIVNMDPAFEYNGMPIARELVFSKRMV